MSGPPLLPYQKNNRLGLLFFLLSGAALLLIGLIFKPLAPPPCIFHSLTGLPCPFCGGTRATVALLHGEWQHSFYLNPLASITLVGLGLLSVIFTVELLLGHALWSWADILSPWKKWLPILLVTFGGWWAFHIFSALRSPKTELLDLRNPVAHAAYEKFRRR